MATSFDARPFGHETRLSKSVASGSTALKIRNVALERKPLVKLCGRHHRPESMSRDASLPATDELTVGTENQRGVSHPVHDQCYPVPSKTGNKRVDAMDTIEGENGLRFPYQSIDRLTDCLDNSLSIAEHRLRAMTKQS
ncbi:hypothetical protein [Mesorhizobium sp. ORS 3428]|uniref:hypothetical protein n=1 Tax=Mesorhizobium sp. ORS 3428 TaxID=540997 RepID=UPI0008D9F9F4|nr:hypothetical protein [Mesorhizobium sp. ORS 3428]OHV78423.1 hypothetical protein ORS3428_28380 [Mesorhizobium sp. ORS 3428]